MPTLQNSVHPYLPNTNEVQSVTVPGAASLWVLFDPLSQTEDSEDYVNVLDGAGALVLQWTGRPPAWPIQVMGNTVQIQLISDASIEFYGYLASITQTRPADNPSDGVFASIVDPVNYAFSDVTETTTPGPFEHGSNLYMVMVYDPMAPAGGGPKDVGIYKSTDLGVTWSRVSGPIVDAGFTVYGGVYPPREQTNPDKIRMCIVCWIDGYIIVGDWDMVTDTWTEITRRATSVAEIYIDWFCTDAVNGVDWLFTAGPVAGVGVTKTSYAVPFSGGVWGAPIPMVSAVGPNHVTLMVARADSVEGRVHMLFRRHLVTSPSGVYPQEYRQLKPDGTVTAAVQLDPEDSSASPRKYVMDGPPAFTGDTVIIPFSYGYPGTWNDTGPGCWILSPITDDIPVLSKAEAPYLDPLYTSLVGAQATEAGGLAYLWWVTLDVIATGDISTIIRYRTFNGSVWGPIVDWHSEDAYPVAFFPPIGIDGRFFWLISSPWRLANGTWAVIVLWPLDAAPFSVGPAVFFGQGAAPPPPVVIPQGGWRREVILIPNRFDGCLAQDLLLHRSATPRGACCRGLVYHDIANVRAPAASIPFRKIAGIPTPLAASGDVVVLDFQVPAGYDGLLTGCFNVYTGPGFLEGGGDIEWRVLVNKVYAVWLGQILVTLGSRAQSYPIDGGVQIQSGQRIRYLVNVPNGSGGILPLNSQIVCGLEGLYYARQ
jgi:hypothetical protein